MSKSASNKLFRTFTHANNNVEPSVGCSRCVEVTKGIS